MIIAARQGLGVSGAKDDGMVKFAMNANGTAGNNFTCNFATFEQSTSFTFSFWFKPNADPIHGAIVNLTGVTSLGNGVGVAVGYGSNGSNLISNGHYAVVLYNSLSWRGGYYVSSYSGWHHYAYVMVAGASQGTQYGSSKRSFQTMQYIDGSQVKSYGSQAMLTDLNKLFVLGLVDGGEARWVNGQVTRLCMRMNKALTATEVADEFSAGFKVPDFNSVTHYWDGQLTGDGKVKDCVGSWHLDINGNASVVALQ